MPPSRKLRTAHFLMFVGVVPLVFAAAVSVAGIASARLQPGQAGASDAFMMIALLLLGYATTVVLGGAGALWSWLLTTRDSERKTTATRILQIMVIAGLVAPPLWYASLRF